ncbi:hypothetical protein RN001_013466 [Aquatica leii]|uniref:DNA-directed RNA polymerase n=1 Tax=Aquatica leii TaxID=1421715 RepID=A0AAN7P2H6_9COLE|nr:hypothetical protein RN001_013466 [Aquatica leii]
MHRFFSIRGNNFCTVPTRKFKESVFKPRVCSLCHKLHNSHIVNSVPYSTHRSVKEKKPKPKYVPKRKTYAEILIVTKDSTKQQKAPVKILSLQDLNFFTKTNLNLAELYKLKALRKIDCVEEHTYHNLTVIDNIWTSSTDCDLELEPVAKPEDEDKVKDHEVIIDENKALETLENIKPTSAFHPEIPEEEHVDVELCNANNDVKASEEVVARTLSPYIEVCNYLKTPQRGLNAFLFHRNRSRNKGYPRVRSINVYNGLLRGFAAKCDYGKICEVLNYAKEDNVTLDVDSYASVFECLGRINFEDNYLKQIRIHAKDALKLGITFDKIMNEAKFLMSQREMVLKAIQSHLSDYKINFHVPMLQYNNNLVNELNHDSQFDAPSPVTNFSKRNFMGKNFKQCVEEQIDVEKRGYITIKSVESKQKVTEETLVYRKAFDDLIKTWEKSALDGFNRDLMSLTARRNILTLEPYLRLLSTKDFVQIIVDEARKIAEGSETYSPTCVQLYRDLGTKVYMRYQILRKQKTGALDKVIRVHSEYCDHYADLHKELDVLPICNSQTNTRQLWQWIEHIHQGDGATTLIDHQAWVPTVLQSIGKFLYHIIMHDLKIDVNIMKPNSKNKNFLPCFYTIFRTQGLYVKEEVKPHPVLSKLHRASVPETLTFFANEVPMMCPPVPWSSVSTGGYMLAPCELMRLPSQAVSQKQRLKEAHPSQIYPALDSLNQLASVPWKVNTQVLDVILEVFKSGGSSRLDVPELPENLTPPEPITCDMDKTQRNILFRQKLQHRRKKAEMYSLWCDCLYRLSLANHFRNDVFWLPHNMDFRGRVYPIPPHLNHLGSDLARSILVFAESRPLGPKGLDWLKLHLVNLTGLKKRDSVHDRLVFANEVMDKVLDSADYPLTGKRWWAQSEEPWQTLACCMEIAAAHRSDDPEKFRSHFPVHQDGSCNGLQHYAALGRDQAGAYSVNLCPSNLPQDVYSAVVGLVEQQRALDEDNGIEIAKILKGFVVRKVIKQTIMTTVYGVTRFGARLQIARQLKDIENFPKEHVWAASTYLTGKTFESLRAMFNSTREIQDWFTECARLISSVCNENVEWVTPLGLPIVQPYNKYRKFNSKYGYQPFHMDKYEKPNVMKQKNAFPPNFIHSLDSSHMMLTSLWCERAGVMFVSVHDCYWTHPSTVSFMNEICRKQFVALHSENILENLSTFLSNKYSYNISHFADDGSAADMTKLKLNRVLRKLPKTGDFNINEVLQSVYFFS